MHPGLFSTFAIIGLTACARAPAGPQIEVQNAWARPSPIAGGNGAIYFQLVNNGSEGDELLGVALIATLGSLYFSGIAGFVPCRLCWYQRILMYPLTLVALVGILQNDDHLPAYILPFSIIGIGVSAYHYLIQLGLFGHPAGCAVGIPCNLRYVNYFGFVTTPFLALIAFILITAIAFAVKWTCAQSDALAVEEAI